MRAREILLILSLALAPVAGFVLCLFAQFTAMTIAPIATNTAFCEGWENGYAAGWCYSEQYGCLPPAAPYCPYPEYDRDTYQDGYNRGFLKGMSDKQNPY